MISVKFDVNGAYITRWSHSPQDIIAMGQSYVAWEAGLPQAQRLTAPSLAMMQAALVAAQAEQVTAGNSEATRAAAAELYRQTLVNVKGKLKLAVLRLKNKYFANLAQLEAWGLETVSTPNGVSVRQPRGEAEWAAFLVAYVAKETSLPVAEQLPDPLLAEMTALLATLQQAHADRTAGRNRRETAVQVRSVLAAQLLMLLQTAAIVLVATRYNGEVSSELQQWGFDVVHRPPANHNTPPAA